MYQCVDVNNTTQPAPHIQDVSFFIPKMPVEEVLHRVQTRFLFRISKISLFAKAISFHHSRWFPWLNYFLFVISIRKVWSVVFMVVVSMLPNAEIWRNDYQEGAPTLMKLLFIQVFRWEITIHIEIRNRKLFCHVTRGDGFEIQEFLRFEIRN